MRTDDSYNEKQESWQNHISNTYMFDETDDSFDED